MPDLLARKEAVATQINKRGQGGSLIFFIALLLFLMAGGAYGGLLLLEKAQKSTEEEPLSQIQEKSKNLQPELIEQIFLLEERLKNINTLINQHTFASNVFKVIEADTHPAVRFTNFAFMPENFSVTMSGETVSYAVLSRQVNILERDPLIEKVDFGGLALTGNNTLGFNTTITFRPTLIQQRPESTVPSSTIAPTSTSTQGEALP